MDLQKRRINTARRIAFGFALLILAGAVLLMLPVSSSSRTVTPFLTSLFTSTSATCVTGLSLVNVGEHFSLFGQIVLLCLIQTGGLGFMMILCCVFLVSKKRIGIRSRMLIAQSVGINSIEGIVLLAKHALSITCIVEAVGSAVLAVRFIPRFGILKGIWFGIFHSVSAFCNAGFDLVGDSMLSYRTDPVMLIALAVLIVIGGLGFIVWEELIKKRGFRRLSVYSKITITASAALIVIGTIMFFLFEYSNPGTAAGYTLPQKILSAFFQSVTTRTAGFDAIGQNNLTEQSKLTAIILMMIGGASGSTAGGIKVVTAVIVVCSLWSVLRARSEAVILGRRITYPTIIHAMTIMTLWLLLTAAGAAAISASDGVSLINSFYETASAYSTVGLSVGITETASVFTKILFIVYMFFGRVGIMTISVVFMARSGRAGVVRYPDGDFFIG